MIIHMTCEYLIDKIIQYRFVRYYIWARSPEITDYLMRYLLCCVIFLSVHVGLHAQERISQLLATLDKAKTENEKINAYNDIFLYYEYSNPDSAVYYLTQGLNHFASVNNKLGTARLTSMLAAEDLAQGKIEMAKKHDSEALKIFTTIDNKEGIAYVNNNLGTIEGKSGNFSEAVKYFMKALKLYESTNNRQGMQITHLKLGVVNERMGDLDKALDFYNRSMALARQSPDSSTVIELYNNLGIVYGKKGKLDEAKRYFERAIQMSDSPKLANIHMHSLMNMGIVYDNMNMNSQALEYYTKAMQIARDGHFPEDYARITLNMASIYDKTDPAKAMAVLKPALDTAKALGQKDLQLDMLDAMITISKTAKDYKGALSYVEEEQALHDTLMNIEKAKEIASIQSVYELSKSNEKVQQLTLSEKRNAQKRNVIIAVACILALTLIGLMFFYRRSQQLNAQLLKRESELSKANTIKDKLFSIIGHDLRSPVAYASHIIDVYREPTTTEDEKKLLLDTLKENADASLDTLDKLLYWGHSQIKGVGKKPATINPHKNIRDIIRLMKPNAVKKQITITDEVSTDIVVYADPAHFDFVVRNLLSNAIKFTYPGGCIGITADNSSKSGFVVFSVRDNGVGMDAAQLSQIFEPLGGSTTGTANEKGTSIGLMLCRNFIRENGGDIWVDSRKGEGSVFYFSLPVSA